MKRRSALHLLFFTFGLVRPKGADWEFVAVRATPLAPPAAN